MEVCGCVKFDNFAKWSFELVLKLSVTNLSWLPSSDGSNLSTIDIVRVFGVMLGVTCRG